MIKLAAVTLWSAVNDNDLPVLLTASVFSWVVPSPSITVTLCVVLGLRLIPVANAVPALMV